jgi:hypothetical protein
LETLQKIADGIDFSDFEYLKNARISSEKLSSMLYIKIEAYL